MAYVGKVEIGSNTYPVGSLMYGTCATAAATAAKVVSDMSFFDTLETGITIHIKFAEQNTASNPTLNVNGTGAKAIYRYGTTAPGTSTSSSWQPGSIVSFTYDGSGWQMNGWLNNNDNTYTSAYCSSSANVAEKTASCTNYKIAANSWIHVIFTNTNTKNSALTLNINGQGAKGLYINGSASSSSNYNIPAGSYLVYYDGTNYQLRTDGKLPGSITGNAATATGFASNKTITLTGDITGSAAGGSGSSGWSIATTIGNEKVTNNMLAGGIENGKLQHSSVTIAGQAVVLGGSITKADMLSNLGLTNALHFVGVATTTITDGGTEDPGITGYVTKVAGDVIIDSAKSYEYVWSGTAWERLGPDGSYKTIQTAVSDPTSSGNAISFIDTISQNANGVISVTKKSVRAASTASDGTAGQSGVVALTSKLDSSATNVALNAAAGKALNDKILALDYSSPSTDGTEISFIDTVSQTNGKIAATKKTVRTATTSQTGVIQISQANANAFINTLGTAGTDVPVDNDYYISQAVNGGANNGTYYRRSMLYLWQYIQGKINNAAGDMALYWANVKVGNAANSATTPTFGSATVTNDITITTTGKGLYLKDSAGTQYAGIYDNGTNLWIGSDQSSGTHHKGSTYISSGYGSDGTTGNASIYMSVPSKSNNTVSYTNYKIAFKANNTSAIGSTSKPVYVNANGQILPGSYEIKANINAGTANQLAYYSAADRIAPISSADALTTLMGTTAIGGTSQPIYWDGTQFATASTYGSLFTNLSWLAGTSAGPTLSVTIGGTNKQSVIPSATDSASGIVTNAAQTFGGNKTLKGHFYPQATNTYALGSSSLRWSKLYVGTADSYGSSTQPIYWNAGVPKAIDISVTDSTTDNGLQYVYKVTQAAGGKITVSKSNIREASAFQSGIVSTGAQTFAGDKTFGGNVALSGETLADSLTAGNLQVNGSANFVNSPIAPTPAAASNDTKVATTEFVKTAISALDGTISGSPGAGKTLTAFSETDGKVSATFGNISITKSQISDFPTSMTPTSHTHGNITNAGELSTASRAVVTDANKKITVADLTVSSATAETTTATTFVHSVTQDAQGKITVKTRPLPTYNNYSLPLAANGTRGGIQIGYSESGTNYAVKLSSEKAYVTVPWTDTKVTAVGNHYAPSADTNAALSASASGANAAWSIDVVKAVQLQRDAKGHVTGVTVTSGKIPANPNTDYRVRQTNDASTNADYRLLLSNSANNTQEDQISRKNANLIYNPSTNKLSTGNIKLTGELDVTGNAYLRNQTTADSLTAGSLIVNGSANFVQSPTAPTPASGDNSTKLATTEFVKTSVAGLSGAMHFKGTTTSTIVDGSTTNPIVIGGSNYTAAAGDVVLREVTTGNIYEYVWTGSAWEMLGRDTSFKVTQDTVASPSASGSTTAFIDTISQDTNGNITVTKKNLDTSGTWSGNAATATKVNNNLVIKLKSGTTEGTDLYTFNGSAGKTLDIKQGTGITLTAAAGSLTIDNAGVRSIATGSTNGTISVNTNGTSADVAVKGLGSAAYTASTAYIQFGGDDTGLGSGSPAVTAKTYWADATKVPTAMIKGYYNHSGVEYSLLFSKATSGTYGSVLKWGYTDTYVRILRIQNGSWKSDDWEKISAGYADSAGSVAWSNVTGKPSTTLVTDTGTSSITLAHGGKYKLTAGGSSIIFTMPTDNNTDTKVNVVARGTTKAYLLATTTSPTSTAQAVTSVAETGVYLDTTAGKLVTSSLAVSGNVNLSGETEANSLTAGNLQVNGSATFVNTINGNISGNAGTATKFANAQSITLTGDTTGTVSSQAGWNIATTTSALTSVKTLGTSDNENIYTGAQRKIQFYQHKNSERPSNCPNASYNSGLIVFSTARNSEDTFQIEYSCNTGDIYTRGWLGTPSTFPAWSTLLSSSNYTTYTVKKDGTGASGTWGISISGTAAKATADGSGNNIVNTYLTKAAGVTNVAWDNTNKKLTKTINGSTTDIVTPYAANLKLNNAATYKAQPEVASVKVNGKTASGDADTASTKNVQLVYDASLEVLNFVFS